jgi:hypothetical protein
MAFLSLKYVSLSFFCEMNGRILSLCMRSSMSFLLVS